MTEAQTKSCQNCKAQFTIEPEDFVFYEKIKVPPPTFCPECRQQRRMTYRNERALCKRVCDLCGKSIIGAYREGTKFPVYCMGCWWSDVWDPTKDALDYDPKKPFLAQYKALQDVMPRPQFNNFVGGTMVNSEYTNCAGELRNCYLIYGCMRDEDCSYSHYINDSRNCIDTLYCIKCENCYECSDIESCSNLQYSQSCLQCRDSSFLFDCRNCSDCIGCVGLRNKQYHILNQPYSKEEYQKRKGELALHTRFGRESFRQEYQKIFLTSPRKYYHGQMNDNFSGDYIANAERTKQSFYTKNAKDCKFMFWCNNARDVYDYMSWGDIELSYECISCGYNNYRNLFTDTCWDGDREIEYSSICFNSSDLFGCIGLRKKQHCILNKQYSEEEYRALRERIIADMSANPYRDARGVAYPYGEFKPIELSPFPYMDTVAQEHYPLTKEEILKSGYLWEEPEKREHTVTAPGSTLPDAIGSVSDGILDEIIGCLHGGTCGDQCTTAFKLTPAELQFYEDKNIPLPQLCYNCRHAARVAMRNPLKLWPRKCMCDGKVRQNVAQHTHAVESCPSEFETSYAPERPEIVYCEACYNAEVA